jgi:hypothetical protein
MNGKAARMNGVCNQSWEGDGPGGFMVTSQGGMMEQIGSLKFNTDSVERIESARERSSGHDRYADSPHMQ